VDARIVISRLEGKFGGGPCARRAECALSAHYAELQALCDALSHAAQLEMSEAINRQDAVARERAYGKWLGVRGIIRAIEAREDEWTPLEWQMLERIDWDRERFEFPGVGLFDGAVVGEPGAVTPDQSG
jgi:ribonuclease HI